MGYRSVFRPGLLDGQSVIVTGGGSGIGRCTAHELAALGARVALVGRNNEKLEKVAAEIAEAGGHADHYACDIRDEDRVRETVAAILEAHGRIDGLVNNAGGQFPALLRDISLKGWDAVVRTNLNGGFLFSRECYIQWMENNGGAIVNITADFWMAMPTMGHSGAARAGMASFTETAALEWGHAGVRVNSVAPGWIASSGMDTYDEETKKVMRGLRNLVPLQRIGTESELSAAVVFLLSEAASFISGSCIRVDGAAPNVKSNWPLPRSSGTEPYNGFHLASLPEALKET